MRQTVGWKMPKCFYPEGSRHIYVHILLHVHGAEICNESGVGGIIAIFFILKRYIPWFAGNAISRVQVENIMIALNRTRPHQLGNTPISCINSRNQNQNQETIQAGPIVHHNMSFAMEFKGQYIVNPFLFLIFWQSSCLEDCCSNKPRHFHTFLILLLTVVHCRITDTLESRV